MNDERPELHIVPTSETGSPRRVSRRGFLHGASLGFGLGVLATYAPNLITWVSQSEPQEPYLSPAASAPVSPSPRILRAATPEPLTAFSSEGSRSEIVDVDIRSLRMALRDYVNPQLVEPYTEAFFEELVTSPDENIIKFHNQARETSGFRDISDRYSHLWRLPHLRGDNYADLSVRYQISRSLEDLTFIDLQNLEFSAFITPSVLPNADELLDTNGRTIQVDKIIQAASSYFILPEDMKWNKAEKTSIFNDSEYGIRGAAFLEDGTLMEVRQSTYGWSKLIVSKASRLLFPQG